VTVAWKKVCTTYEEGDLGLRSLVTLNSVTNLKSCWDLFQSDEQWAYILRSRVLRDSNCIQYYVSSSTWNGAKSEYHVLLNNSNSLVGDGNKINC